MAAPLVPQGLAIPATETSAKVAEAIAKRATESPLFSTSSQKRVRCAVQAGTVLPGQSGETGKLTVLSQLKLLLTAHQSRKRH